ncbi:hypothetical protein LJ128_003674 [Salmonella enterica]|uniref:Uncharacterized protein n=1 Tax=Salmonella enterica subsp. salamae serovar 47:b:1,5 TaxID=1967619 RepID=A0A701UM13_SALER|nr:hypothetical protein [Salmonella enterica]ECI2307157.1 hypothetical protein [Salmonella enterica subsp. enterica serovar Infantis]EDN2303617.1 hypothetical protein [Salmonella enterica subsp. diarizonae serovar 65:(k):z]EDW4290071.1 hypothetical protein [Salmonella enterica subsp. diarizonae]EGO1766604.1 hypothetical protein [Salmonella enterica subsp. diarizonae serovar Rough:-:-]HAC6516352.1 hypothetical protein [Salmonella enterica subsp. salamae serovar 47:b:1,5]
MGKYFDDYEREADYQNWLYYRESSHEEREYKSRYTRFHEEPKENVAKLVVQQAEWTAVDVFRDYPEHKARIAAAEKKYYKSEKAERNCENDYDDN